MLAMVGVFGAYGLQARMAVESERATKKPHERAAAIKRDLRRGTVLFVPDEGNVCRQRFIDNETWVLRDTAPVICDEAASWNTAVVPPEDYVNTRLGAVRGSFAK